VSESESKTIIGLKIPKCRVEIKWIVDIFYFILFLLIALLVPLKQKLGLLEVLVFFGIGFSLAILVFRDHSKLLLIPLSLLIVLLIFMAKGEIDWELSWEDIPKVMNGFLNFIRYTIHTVTWLLLGNMIGSISFSAFDYIACKKGFKER